MSTSKIVLVLDISTSNLDLCVKVMLKFIQQRMYNTPRNTIAVIFAGTENTDVSQITGNVDKFDNITLVRPLIPGDKELLDILQNVAKYTKNSTKINLNTALEVAVRLFNQEKSKTHWMSENRIMLFTDDHGRFEKNTMYLVEEIKLIKPQIVFKLIGPNLYDDCKIQDLPKNVQNMSSFCNQVVDGECFSIEDAVQVTAVYKIKSIRQTPVFKGCLEVGSSLKLPVFAYTKIQPVTPATLKMCDSKGGAVSRDRSYHLQDENQTPVDPDCINKGYRYGKTYIPISKVDMDLMKTEVDKQLKLICTTKRSNIRKEELLTSHVHSITTPPGDTTAGRALAAFAVGLKEQDLVAICRYVKKDDAKTQLCCLVPNVKDWSSTLMMIELPYANDIRKAQFSRLKSKPSEDQLAAVDKLIDSMNLSTDKCDIKSTKIPNPNIQRRFDCVVHRAMYPEKLLPSADISQYLQFPKFSCESATKDCIREFGITKTEKKTKKRTAGDMFKDEDVSEMKKVKKEDISLDDLLGTEIKVGTTNPIKDFALVQNKFGPKLAVDQLSEVIRTLVQHGADNNKIADCLQSLRECCVIENLFYQFNDFLKQTYSNAVMKNICQSNLVSLIHSGECSTSTISPKESEMFLCSDKADEEIQAALDDDDDDDLLDMI